MRFDFVFGGRNTIYYDEAMADLHDFIHQFPNDHIEQLQGARRRADFDRLEKLMKVDQNDVHIRPLD